MSSKIQTLERIVNAAGKAAGKFARGVFDITRKTAGKVGCGIAASVHRVLEKNRNRQKSTPDNRPPVQAPIQKTVKRSRAASVKNKTVAVVPVYNHGETVGDVVATLRGYGLPVILIDDGSDTFTARTLDAIVFTLKSAFGPPVKLVRLPKNRGKGAAVMTGFRSAFAHGATHVLQVDADGQHGLEVVPKFLNVSVENPDAVVAGYPLYDAMVPRVRFYGSRLSRLLVWVTTLSRRIAGPMCGFRLYPLAKVKNILPATAQARRMEFDTEIAVRLDWEKVPFINLPVAVRYPFGGVSHFRVVRDSLLIAFMHARLFFGMIYRLLAPLFRCLSRFLRSSRLPSRCTGLIARISDQLFTRLSRYSSLLSRRFRRP
jgi:glycosyltransferase involved in cell wall biosynthesis